MEKTQNKEREAKAKEYDKLHNWLFLVDLAVTVILLGGIMIGGENGLSFKLQHFVEKYTGTNPWFVTAGYVAGLLIIYTVVMLPYSWWKGFYLEHKYELSNQTFFNWIWDEIKSLALNILLGIIVFEIFYAFIRGTGSAWWIWAACAWIALQVILGMLFPVLILPLFYKTGPLDRPDLQEKLENLAKKAGVNVLGMFRLDMSEKTKKANAMMAGLGKTKRILLGDTLLDKFTDGEVVSVLAHEFGHFYHKHIWKLMVIASLLAFGGMWLADKIIYSTASALNIGGQQITDIATLPLLLFALLLFGLITMPITNIISRYFERQADLYALKSTNDVESFITAMERLADQNLSNREPHPAIEFLLHSHPSIAKRIKFAQKFELMMDV